MTWQADATLEVLRRTEEVLRLRAQVSMCDVPEGAEQEAAEAIEDAVAFGMLGAMTSMEIGAQYIEELRQKGILP